LEIDQVHEGIPVKPVGDHRLDKLEALCVRVTRPIAFLGVIGMLVVSGITIVDVTGRWLFNQSLAALNEVISMTFAVAIAACIPAGLAQGVNLKVDLLEHALTGRWKAWLAVIGDLLLAVFFGLLAWRIGVYAGDLYDQGRVTVILGWRQAPFIYAAAILLAAGVAVQLIVAANALRRAIDEHAQNRFGETSGSLLGKIYVAAVAVAVAALIVIGIVNFPFLQKFAQSSPGWTVSLACILLWMVLLTLMPLAAVMGLTGLVGTALFLGFGPGFSAFATEATGFLTNSLVAVLPLFLLMGSFAAVAGLADDAYALAHALLCKYRGGLAMATIGGSAGFGAVTGSSVATAATIGRVALPEMRARGYSPALSTGCVAAGGTLGNLVPPGSGPLVLFALLTEASIGQLFIGSMLPAILVVAVYLLTIVLFVRFVPNSAPQATRRQSGELASALKRSGPLVFLFVGVLGGMYAGIFTVTESAAVGAVGAFLVALFRGKLKPAAFWSVMAETTAVTAMIYTLIFGALIFAFFTEISGLSETAATFITSLGWPPLALVALLIAIFIVLGTFMDSYAIMITTIPIVTPMVLGAGYDIVWWGIINLFVIEIGAISPPFGLIMFVLKSIADVPLITIFRGVMPFCVAAIAALAILVLFPEITLWLPSTMLP
jgi:tripartite ATP-independent transporter DctM subunit